MLNKASTFLVGAFLLHKISMCHRAIGTKGNKLVSVFNLSNREIAICCALSAWDNTQIFVGFFIRNVAKSAQDVVNLCKGEPR